jgi:phage-related protein
MKNLPTSVLTEKAKSEIRSFKLLKLDTYYFTDCDQSIQYSGDTYSPRPIILEGFSASGEMPLEGGTIKIGDVDLTIASLVLNNSLKDKDVVIYETYFDSSMNIVGTELVFEGRVEGQELPDEYWAVLKVSPYRYSMNITIPRRYIIRLCGWTFKSSDCGYSGSETDCSKTWERCGVLGNRARFGGFPFLPKKGTRIMWNDKEWVVK